MDLVKTHSSLAGSMLFLIASHSTADPASGASTDADDFGEPLQGITVSADRLSLVGTAFTASEGAVAGEELALLPAFRPGQLLEAVPGLDVTVHSGEGKASQYLMRGYNLDHGTDLAAFIDGIPVNQPTHAHGQGYTDLNFLIPELAANVSYTKGTYYADEGDFSSVGSVHINYRDTIPDQVSLTGGTLDYQRLLAASSTPLSEGNLLGALELQHYDGPWVNPDDQRKINAVLRYSVGDQQNGYSITGSFDHDLWNAATDQPERAIAEGLISRFGSLDPSDGGISQRANISANYHASAGSGELNIGAYAFNNQLTLWNDFTHFLVDPVHGDQEEQHENRNTVGGSISYAYQTQWFGKDNEVLVGAQERFDFLGVQRVPTEERIAIPLADNPLGAMDDDQVHLGSNAIYVQDSTHWNEWFRSVLGLREDYQRGTDEGTNHGTASRGLTEPKVNLIFGVSSTTDLYVSAGRGFHSDDLRGVNQARNAGVPGAPLIAAQIGEEIGVRQTLDDRQIALTLALFNLDAQSETTYNPDIGQDSAGPASRRIGYELNITYQPLRWLEVYGSLSQDRARFKTPYDDGTGHLGEYLPNAPFATGSFNLYVKDLGPWSGGLEYRYLGAFPLSSGPCVNSAVVNDFPGLKSCDAAPTAKGQVDGHGYGEWNLDLKRVFADGWRAMLGIYNLFNKKADAMEYWYVDRLHGEPAVGAADVHAHPLEPISLRMTLLRTF
ncbi:MAG: TonB-dependent receptor plug domain-containing protein [Steroidobacteraceae bacterium]|jgi:outer membrane receptor protein involved in Fe transport